MNNNFCGNYKCNDIVLEIKKNQKTFTCKPLRKNIGIIFKNKLIVSEFDDNIQVGGVGVYSPIGDGNSYFALWSSTNIIGVLGSGIALKCVSSSKLGGDYSVRYFVGNSEAKTFLVNISQTQNENIYQLSWFSGSELVLHGIGLMVEDSLAFAWGSTNCNFDVSVLNIYDNDGVDILRKQTVSWNTTDIQSDQFFKMT